MSVSAKAKENTAQLVETARDVDGSLHEQHYAFTQLVTRIIQAAS